MLIVKCQTARKQWFKRCSDSKSANKYAKEVRFKYNAQTIIEPIKQPTSAFQNPHTKRQPSSTKLLLQRAHEAGDAAAKACTPTPMIVQQRENPLDDSSRVIKEYSKDAAHGSCGFAQVIIKPGNCKVAMLLKQRGLAAPHYKGGVSMGIMDYGQSYERKIAYAHAYARVLSEAGINAYGNGWED